MAWKGHESETSLGIRRDHVSKEKNQMKVKRVLALCCFTVTLSKREARVFRPPPETKKIWVKAFRTNRIKTVGLKCFCSFLSVLLISRFYLNLDPVKITQINNSKKRIG